MRETFETLLLQRSAGKLSRSERREFLSLIQNSAAFRHMAARDRLIDRLLQESFRPALKPEIIFQALPPRDADLPGRTMAAIAAAAPTKRTAQASRGNPAEGTCVGQLLAGLSVHWRAAFPIGLALIATLTWLVLQRPPLPEIGRVIAVVGSPIRFGATQKNPAVLQSSHLIRFGDRLETGDADKAELQFNDGTSLLLGFNTALELAEPKDSKVGYSRPSEVKLLRGEVWTKVQKATNATQYAIATDVATAVARGTEFGVKLRRTRSAATNSAASSPTQQATNEAVLTVKEGTVDFFNAHGTVQATAMRESTARAGFAPSEPKRLEKLQVMRLTVSSDWSILTSQLDWPEVAQRLALGGGWLGLRMRDIADGGATLNAQAGQSRTQVWVTHVATGSPAAAAGLRTGDVAVAVDGQRIDAPGQFSRMSLPRSGEELVLTLEREGQSVRVTMRVGAQQPVVPGPMLQPAQAARLRDITGDMLRAPAPLAERPVWAGQDPAVQAAVQNDLGVLFEAEDALGSAVRAYERAVNLAPNVPLYRYNRGLALRKIGSFEGAAEELQAAAALAPGSSEILKRLAEVLSLRGDNREALAIGKGLLNTAAQDHGVWELWSQLLLKEGRFAEAHDAAGMAMLLDPDCAVPHAYAAAALDAKELPEEALAEYTRALELEPLHPLLHLNVGASQHEVGQLEEAEQSLRKAIHLRPDLALAHLNLGRVLLDKRDLAGADASLRRSVELDPDDGNAFYSLGMLHIRRRDFGAAETAFHQALALLPTDHRCYYGLGEALRLRGNLDESEKLYRRALELKPDFANAQTGLGVISFERRQFDEAERLYQGAIQMDAKDSAPYHNLGEINLHVRRDLETAEQLYRKAIELGPREAAPLSGLARVLMLRGELGDAEALLRRAYTLETNSPQMCNNLGEVLRLQGRLEEAEPHYRQALKLDPSILSAYGNLGIISMERGRFAEAEKVFGELLARTAGGPAQHRLPAVVNLAIASDKLGKVEAAEKLFREALGAAPDEPRILVPFARFLAEHGMKLEEAALVAQRAVQATPTDAEALQTLGFVEFRRGNFQAGESLLNQALEKAGEQPLASKIREDLQDLEITRSIKGTK